MLLIKKQNDYYDQILSHGVDKSIIYHRELKEYFFKISQYNSGHNVVESDMFTLLDDFRHNIPNVSSRFNKLDYTAESFLIGFCGKIYFGYRLTTSVIEYTSYNPVDKVQYAYSVEDIISFFKKYNLTDSLEKFMMGDVESKYFRKRSNKNHRPTFCLNDTKAIFTRYNDNKVLLDIFQNYKSPIFYVTYNTDGLKMIINTILKDYDFISQVDPYTAGQEISMYISGVLGTSNPNIVQVSDKTKITKAGFDKFSFRKGKV